MNQETRRVLTKVFARLLEKNPMRTATDIAEYQKNLKCFVRNAVLRLPPEGGVGPVR